MKKIVFINPSIGNTVFGKMKMLALPPMGLGILASRTPDTYEKVIVDENVDTVDFDMKADLVAVTATTVQAPRAYRILGEFRKRGVPTVMGGIHASVRTDEASRYADSVAIGEGDELWPRMLVDFERGEMKKVYHAKAYPSLAGIPRVDRSLFSKKYMIHSVQTSRGCPCNCSFCSVTRFNGSTYRFRDIDGVIEEIGGMKDKRLFIADDSIVGLGNDGIDHARRLFSGLKGMKKSWGSQVCITIAEHDDLLRAAAEAGANTFYIGFESIEAESLKKFSQPQSIREHHKEDPRPRDRRDRGVHSRLRRRHEGHLRKDHRVRPRDRDRRVPVHNHDPVPGNAALRPGGTGRAAALHGLPERLGQVQRLRGGHKAQEHDRG